MILAEASASEVRYDGVAEALAIPETQVLLFGKAEARPLRRMGVALARVARDAEEALLHRAEPRAAEPVTLLLSDQR